MILECIDGVYMIVKCEKCGTAHKRHKTYCKQYGNEYHFNPPITCTCGNVESIAYERNIINTTNEKSDIIRCPKCLSTQISANNKGFSLGKAAIGGIAFGAIGLLGGLIGNKDVIITCLKCGHQWKAGKI